MKKIKKVQAGKIYAFCSSSAANSTYFENTSLVNVFMKYCNYYLKDYLTIHDYHLNQDGWICIVQIKSANTIYKYAKKHCSKYKNNQENKGIEIWKIISERMRLFLSTYVRVSNKLLGRKGVLVRQSYDRIGFSNLAEAQSYIYNICQISHTLQQPKQKYRAPKLKISKKVQRETFTSEWMKNSWDIQRIREKARELFGTEISIFGECSKLVLQKLKKENIYPKKHFLIPNHHPT